MLFPYQHSDYLTDFVMVHQQLADSADLVLVVVLLPPADPVVVDPALVEFVGLEPVVLAGLKDLH